MPLYYIFILLLSSKYTLETRQLSKWTQLGMAKAGDTLVSKNQGWSFVGIVCIKGPPRVIMSILICPTNRKIQKQEEVRRNPNPFLPQHNQKTRGQAQTQVITQHVKTR